MKYQSMYTNTSNAKAIVGLLIVTFATTAVALYTPQICQGIVALTKTGKDKVEQLAHRGKKQYAVAARTYDGRIFDTGDRIWK
jgi:hypothetical protein